MANVADVSPLSEPKGLIYHYTSQAGLLGITEKKQIWATNLRYLNDIEEFRVGVRLLERVMQEARTLELVDQGTLDSLKNLLATLESFEFYAASFSQAENGDSLNLWRSYAKSLPGYSIGIDADKLRNAIRPTLQSSGMRWLSKVHYIGKSVELGKELSSWSLSTMISLIKDLDRHKIDWRSGPDKTKEDWFNALLGSVESIRRAGMILAAIFPTLKDSAFSGELEARVIQIGHTDMPSYEGNPPDFHLGSWSIVPHMNIPISLGPDQPPLIERIVVGPCPHPAEALKAVQILLSSKRISGIEIVSSQVPYRSW